MAASGAVAPRAGPRGGARLLVYGAAYGLWLANAALAALLLPLTRAVVLRASVAFELGPWVLGAADQAGLLLVAGLWLVWVTLTEEALRRAAGERHLLRAAGRVLGGTGLTLLALTAAALLLR